MAGYAAMARVEGGRVRALAWAPPWDGEPATPDGRLELAADRCDLHPPPTFEDRWRWFCDELGMLTFFLLDPESWR